MKHHFLKKKCSFICSHVMHLFILLSWTNYYLTIDYRGSGNAKVAENSITFQIRIVVWAKP